MGQQVVADYEVSGDNFLLSFSGRMAKWSGGMKYWVQKNDCVIRSFDYYYKEI